MYVCKMMLAAVLWALTVCSAFATTGSAMSQTAMGFAQTKQALLGPQAALLMLCCLYAVRLTGDHTPTQPPYASRTTQCTRLTFWVADTRSAYGRWWVVSFTCGWAPAAFHSSGVHALRSRSSSQLPGGHRTRVHQVGGGGGSGEWLMYRQSAGVGDGWLLVDCWGVPTAGHVDSGAGGVHVGRARQYAWTMRCCSVGKVQSQRLLVLCLAAAAPEDASSSAAAPHLGHLLWSGLSAGVPW
jgi:hypothetical protein